MRGAFLLVAAVVLGACGGEINQDDGAPDPDDGTAAPDGSVDAPPASDPSSAARLTCVTETNRLRALKSKPAVTQSATLEAFAATGAMEDFNGSPHDHFIRTNGGGISFAENECPHWNLGQQGGGDLSMLVKSCIAAFYSEGPGGGHYENMMGNYGSLGCGIYESGGAVTIIQDYGR